MVAGAGAYPQSPVAPKGASFKSITWEGTACNGKNVSYAVTPALDQFSLLFDGYYLQKDPSADDLSLNCGVKVNLNVPGGWSYSLVAAEFSGYFYLDQGVSASQNTVYQFFDPVSKALTSARGKFNSQFAGPRENSYFRTDRISAIDGHWTPCSQQAANSLMIYTQVSVAGNGFGYMSLDQLTAGIQPQDAQRYMLSWKPCKYTGKLPPVVK